MMSGKNEIHIILNHESIFESELQLWSWLVPMGKS